jgi:hypothetical protein
MATTWDTNLVHETATVLSDEARAICNGCIFLNAPPKVAGPFADKKASQDTGGQQPKRADRVKPMVGLP